MTTKTYAMSVPQSYRVINAGTLPDGEDFLTVDCQNYDAFLNLPAGMVYDNKQYGLTGWNSDVQLAYYKANHKIGKAV